MLNKVDHITDINVLRNKLNHYEEQLTNLINDERVPLIVGYWIGEIMEGKKHNNSDLIDEKVDEFTKTLTEAQIENEKDLKRMLTMFATDIRAISRK